ncbi:MAG: DUF4886 domain-containing protein [Candidatus Izemoplasmatales bacterium]
MKKIITLFLLFLIAGLVSCQMDTTTTTTTSANETTTSRTTAATDTLNPLSLNVGNNQGWTFYSNYKTSPSFGVNHGQLTFTQKEADEDWGSSTTWARKMTYNSLSFTEGTTYTVSFDAEGTLGEEFSIQVYDSSANLIVDEQYTLDGTLQTFSFEFTPEITVLANGILVIGLGTFNNDSTISISNINIHSEVIVNEEVNILFIGNSFTYYNNMPTILSLMASTSGYQVHVEQITYGGFQLSQYVTLGTPETDEVVSKINERAWDYVILQEQSSKPATDKQGFIDAVGELNQLIEASGAKTILYSTWSYRDGSSKLASTGYTYTEFYNVLTSAYQEASALYNTMLAPVGTVFYQLTMNEPTINLLDYADDFHPTIDGSYVAAYTFYLTIFGNERTNTYHPSSLTVSRVAILEQYVKNVLDIE